MASDVAVGYSKAYMQLAWVKVFDFFPPAHMEWDDIRTHSSWEKEGKIMFSPIIRTGAISATGAAIGMIAAGVTAAPATILGIAAGSSVIALAAFLKNQRRNSIITQVSENIKAQQQD